MWDDDEFLVFYTSYQTQESVSSAQPKALNRLAMIQTALAQLKNPGDFFGIIDIKEVLLQLTLEEDHVQVEMPVPEKRGSLIKIVPKDQLKSLLEHLPRQLTPDWFEQFEYRSWSS